MTQELSRGARRVQEVLSALGIESPVVELPATTRTAADAAYVRGKTSFSIGGTPNSVVRLSSARLLEMTGGTATSIK